MAEQVARPVRPSALLDTLSGLLVRDNLTRGEESEVILAERFPHSVLVVEDNAVSQKILCAMLQKLGYTPDVAHNGVEALEALRRRPYGVVLMDTQMPEMSGEEATCRIRSDWPESEQPRVIGVVANALDEERQHCLSLGMDDCVSKPVKLVELSRVIEKLPSRERSSRPAG